MRLSNIIAQRSPPNELLQPWERDDMSSSTFSPPKITELFDNFDNLLDSLVPIGIIIAVLMVILGGYKWMSSAGDPEKVKQAQGTLTWAIIGLVLLLLVGLLIQGLVDYIVGM